MPSREPSLPRRVILDCIRTIVRSLRISSREAERELGLTSAQLFVLQKLRRGDKLSINELAELTFTHQSSVSAVVAKLADQGLVKRSVSAKDARRIEVSLTPEGKAAIARAPEAAQARLLSSIALLPEPDQRKLADLLAKVTSTTDGAGAPPPLFFEDERPGQARTGRQNEGLNQL
jgi:DNA-binding MarR family transcriptional regulator